MTEVAKRLHDLCRRGRLPHALLFIAPPHFSILDTTLSIVRHLLCENVPERKPCGECAACRKVMDQNHPDVLHLRPEKQEITVEQIRGMQTWINRGPFEGVSKVAILEDAHVLNQASSNSLLKTLEEPPPYAFLFLLCRSSDPLLPTLRSRLQLFRFSSPENEIAIEASMPEWWDNFERLFSNPEGPRAAAIFSLTEEIGKDRASLPLLFQTLERKLRDQMLEIQKSGSSSARLHHLDSLFDQTLRAERDLVKRYGNVPLILDDLFLRWFSTPQASA